MDPIHPIAPGPGSIQQVRPLAVQKLPPVSRERDRPDHERSRSDGKRREPEESTGQHGSDGEDEPDGPRHIDVRA